MKIIILMFLTLMMTEVQAKTKINKVSFEKTTSGGKIIIETKGMLNQTPELLIKGNIVQVTVPNSFVWPKIDKRVGLIGSLDTTLMAYQYDKDIVRVRAILPYSVSGIENKVSLILKNSRIILNFPIRKMAKKTVNIRETKKHINVKNNTTYDERYLEALLADSKELPKNKLDLGIKESKPNSDTLKIFASAPTRNLKKQKSEFSIWTYILKFLSFLGIVLILFYAMVFLMRKGVMKKGKLGFFNSSNLVEVLSTTHVGPKKSLLMVKAHKQVFLVSSTEKGMEFLSEISDVAGLIKTEEKEALGSNFDLSLVSEKKAGPTFKIKEDITKVSLDDSYQKNRTPKKAISKYSDQIKNKLKNLKPLQ